MEIRSKALAFGAVSMFAIEASALTVYTYSSFTADWGPGPKIEQAFEATCGCDVELVGLDDGVSLLTRLRLEGERSKADIVLGLDNNLIAEAEATGLLAPHGVDLSHLRLPVAWDDPTFVPFDYGWFAFVYNRENLVNPPSSLGRIGEGAGDSEDHRAGSAHQHPGARPPAVAAQGVRRRRRGPRGRRSSPGSSPSPRDGARPTGSSSKARRRWC